MTAYYNEIDPYAAQWLRNLISAGRIAPGDVDERDIRDVHPDDLRRYVQCHFFAGIGVWSYGLRLAGWPDDRPVWTGSCPCQPFSAAGKGGGFDDERHLWPAFHHLIRECRPAVVLGEQVASRDGLAWLDLVQADLEGTGYASGAVDLCAAGVGAPHIRQRLWWVGERLEDAELPSGARQRDSYSYLDSRRDCERPQSGSRSGFENGGLAEPHGRERDRLADGERRIGNWPAAGWQQGDGEPEPRRIVGGLADAAGCGCEPCEGHTRVRDANDATGATAEQLRAARSLDRHEPTRPTDGFWRDADWLFCRDGKWRPVEPGTFPLAHGAPARVGRLRAYGNAIVAQAAATFIGAYVEASMTL